MRKSFNNYTGERGFYSLALEESVKDDLLSEGVQTLFVSEDGIYRFPEGELIETDAEIIEFFQGFNNYDVFEVFEDGYILRSYNNCSTENVLFITEKCNSNCVMCPSPEAARRNGVLSDMDDLIELAKHIPSDTSHLTITGGEPFMVGKELFRLLDFCKVKFEDTEFLILTNGRVFAIKEYCELLGKTIPNRCIVAIPLHGSNSIVHDSITQADGSFEQTCLGLKRIQKMGIETEIRLVVNKMNVTDLESIANLIVDSFHRVSYVSIMALEMTGNAFVNSEHIWIPYKDSFEYVRKAVNALIRAGINVRLYNFPLCTVDKEMRTLCHKSITEYKRKYASECNECSLRDSCGGLFAGTFKWENTELKAVR